MSEKGERKDIPWMRFERENEPPVEYRFTGSHISNAEIAAAPKRTMDCVDCHNRPTHVYRTADRNWKPCLASGPNCRQVPYLKKAASEVLARRFSEAAIQTQRSRTSALGVVRRVTRRRNPIRRCWSRLRSRCRRSTAGMSGREMNIGWGTYPNLIIGHTASPGCLRCHGNNHVTAEGKAVRADCRLCHTILALDEEKPPLFDFMVHKEK